MNTLILAQESANSNVEFGAIGLIILLVLGLALLALFIYTVVSIVTSDLHSTSDKAGWILALFGFTFIAMILWFAWAKNDGSPSSRSDDSTPIGNPPPPPNMGTAYDSPHYT